MSLSRLLFTVPFSLLMLCSAAFAAEAEPLSLRVNPDNRFQEIQGHGASSAWFADELSEFAQAEREAIVRFLFDPEVGLGLNVHRIRISPKPFEGAAYNWADEKLLKQAAFIRYVQDTYDPILLAVPWTPPAVMKTNRSHNNGGELVFEYYGVYADYLADYVLGMRENFGISIDILSVQNEPDEGKQWESAIWDSSQFTEFVSNSLLPVFAKRGVDVKLMLNENTSWDDTLLNATLANETVAQAIDYAAAHLYHRTHDKQRPFEKAEALGLPVWMTEFYYGDYNLKRDFTGVTPEDFTPLDRTLKLAEIHHDAFTKANANAYLFWWMLAFSPKEAQALLKSPHSPKIESREPFTEWSPNLWAFGYGQFSRFIRPGFDRVEATLSTTADGLLASAYAGEDDTLALVLINLSETPQTLELSLENANNLLLEAYRTSETDRLNKVDALTPLGLDRWEVTLAPRSITTLATR